MLAVYPRDMLGYGQNPPHPNWPNKSLIAIQFVLNYEEGAENSVLHGDEQSETFLSDIVGAQAFNDRHMSMESLYEYGSRAGFWRLHRLFKQYQIPITVFAVTMALKRNPQALEAMMASDWEIASHAMRWINFQSMPLEQERAMMQQSIDLHEQLTGAKPAGWYTGRTSPNTLKLVAENPDILYCADTYADDLPYYDHHYSRPLLMVPYTLEANDMRFATPQGFNTGDHFYHYLKDTFDVLYAEGEHAPKMMSIGLHCRLAGRPGKIAGLIKFLKHIQQYEDVWICTRQQIAQHWLKHFPLTNV
ncbi:allantoinase PuuE [Aliiglaciecola sp.]|nr:allantoinase PuuE [Aliiglaciecola sp.]